MDYVLTEELASRFARVALANIEREYPRHVLHFMAGPEPLRPQREVHPAFYGSYDWHSAVHMHWLLVRVLRLYPVARVAPLVSDALDSHLTAETLARELAYFQGPSGRTFERPYGWAWLLELQAEALAMKSRWSRALEPLAAELAGRMGSYLRMSPYPVRAGTHGNSAFACLLALDYARTAKDTALELEIRKAARRWYERDRDAPLAYEPSLDDFLSPALTEAALMRQVLEEGEFFRWFERFAPQGLGALAEPPTVLDHADPKQSHLDGLCLSRAWCFQRLGDANAAEALVAAAMEHVVGGDYAGEHWLASFAVLALSTTSLPRQL
ncbi:MAG TPA: DUF2891 domain-containing protein [Burkholderiales bacterium]|nr:DUF2891 domain-containing protein [Burkholderiales bacterium]